MEFFMNYGWAVLIVIAVIGVLVYSGALSGENILPESCVIGEGITCDSFKVDAAEDNVRLLLRNSKGQQLKDVTVSIGTCIISAEANGDDIWENGQVLGGTDGIELSSCDIADNSKTKTPIILTYKTSGNIEHTVKGEIIAKAEGALQQAGNISGIENETGPVQETICADGTANYACSSTKPKYCINGTLSNNCASCGCPSGQNCLSNGSCMTPVQNQTQNQTCSGGIPYGSCSATKPLYCSNGTLINNCALCGCTSGKTCLGNASCGTVNNCSIGATCDTTKADGCCPSNCLPDVDCCTQSGKYWYDWYGCSSNPNLQQGVGNCTTSTLTCNQNSNDGCCPTLCVAGTDRDCCVNKGWCWIPGQGCYSTCNYGVGSCTASSQCGVSDNCCPNWCSAGSDPDCCANKGWHWFLTPLGLYSCYETSSPGVGATCTNTTLCDGDTGSSDGCCPNWCAAGSDEDCCNNIGRCYSRGSLPSCNTC